MLDKDIYPFFIELKQNNHKDWFDLNRKRYEHLRQNFVAFTKEVIQGIAEFDPSIALQDASKAVFRINRDVRFSANKDPYKTHIAFSLSPGGRTSEFASYYFQLDPANPFAGAGVYAPQPDTLKAIRNEMYFNPDAFLKSIQTPKFKKIFGDLDEIESLKKAPKGFEDAADKIIPYLKHKHFVASVGLQKKDIFSADFAQKLVEIYKAEKEFVAFLNDAIRNA